MSKNDNEKNFFLVELYNKYGIKNTWGLALLSAFLIIGIISAMICFYLYYLKDNITQTENIIILSIWAVSTFVFLGGAIYCFYAKLNVKPDPVKERKTGIVRQNYQPNIPKLPSETVILEPSTTDLSTTTPSYTAPSTTAPSNNNNLLANGGPFG